MEEPTATGTFTRRQAPEAEVSSSLAAEVWRVPNWSSQETSTTAIMAVLGSILIALILSLCIGRNWKWFRGVSVFRCFGVSVGRDDDAVPATVFVLRHRRACAPITIGSSHSLESHASPRASLK